MAAGIINLQKESGGIVKISPVDGTGVTELVVPESGNLVSVDTAVTDNSIARYDGTTGKLQNSSVVIDDSGNVGIGTSSPTAKLQVAGGFSADTLGSFPSLISSGGYGGGIGLFDTNGYVGMYATESGKVLNFFTNANNSNTVSSSKKMILDAGGSLLLTSGTGCLGYGAGSGGTVTQLTSKSTAVTLNKPTGVITMASSALAAGDSVEFVVYNSLITQNDTVILNCNNTVYYGYRFEVRTIVTGAVVLRVTNIQPVSLSEAVTFNFTLIKGANA